MTFSLGLFSTTPDTLIENKISGATMTQRYYTCLIPREIRVGIPTSPCDKAASCLPLFGSLL